MKNVVLAVDIGASSGRVIKAWMNNQTLELNEVHRFKNKMTYDGRHYHWDIEGLFLEIIEGLKKASVMEDTILSVGIDTWAVDYVLLDKNGERVAPVFAYRDHRTDSSMEEVFNLLSREKIYETTGIQFLQFNTLYQLYEHIKANPEHIEKAASFLMIPDYLNYRLSGVKSIEYTNATSTQLLDVYAKDWDATLLKTIGLKASLLETPVAPGTVLGELQKDIEEAVNLPNLKVIAPATHDTGSAIVSVPAIEDEFAYISSGTWSLMGIESKTPIVNKQSSAYNFTNEGGVFNTYRVLKNIMGLWLIQEVARIYKDKYSFAQFVELAKECQPFRSLINPNDSRFLNPVNMVEAIKDYCKETGQIIPNTPGEIARCIFESLAFLYRVVLEELREISETPIKRIHIIGGGCQNKLLNQLCADLTGCEVYAGPVEATAIGNIAMQMITNGTIKDLENARDIIRTSFEVEVYKPLEIKANDVSLGINSTIIEENYEKFRRLQNEQ